MKDKKSKDEKQQDERERERERERESLLAAPPSSHAAEGGREVRLAKALSRRSSSCAEEGESPFARLPQIVSVPLQSAPRGTVLLWSRPTGARDIATVVFSAAATGSLPRRRSWSLCGGLTARRNSVGCEKTAESSTFGAELAASLTLIILCCGAYGTSSRLLTAGSLFSLARLLHQWRAPDPEVRIQLPARPAMVSVLRDRSSQHDICADRPEDLGSSAGGASGSQGGSGGAAPSQAK